ERDVERLAVRRELRTGVAAGVVRDELRLGDAALGEIEVGGDFRVGRGVAMGRGDEDDALRVGRPDRLDVFARAFSAASAESRLRDQLRVREDVVRLVRGRA